MAVPRNPDRLLRIAQARQQALQQPGAPDGLVEPWIARSWERCLALGLAPTQRVAFAAVSGAERHRTEEANRALVLAARPVLEQLGRAMMDTRYFAILTNQHGVVVDAHGAIDRSDRRADLITRIGTDLSESSVGTTAIGAALNELAPVWLHRGEHFFDDTSDYSCAGAPLFGPQGQCVGMLDLTGVQALERPELRHLVVQSARSIENALTLAQAHAVLLRLNWPGRTLGDETDGLLGLDADGGIRSANSAARQLLPQLNQSVAEGWHCRDLFALPFEKLFDAARRDGPPMEVPLWSGLRLQLLARRQSSHAPARSSALTHASAAPPSMPLKDVETALIQKAVRDARGNVAQAARLLGISRATVYRKLGQGNKPG
jgi:transcriptional regulator of acetoin/glycerol metabolism